MRLPRSHGSRSRTAALLVARGRRAAARRRVDRGHRLRPDRDGQGRPPAPDGGAVGRDRLRPHRSATLTGVRERARGVARAPAGACDARPRRREEARAAGRSRVRRQRRASSDCRSRAASQRSVRSRSTARRSAAVTVDVPLNDALLAELRDGGERRRDDRLALVQNGRTIAGAPPGVGKAPARQDGRRHPRRQRVPHVRRELVGPPTNVSLVASTPRSASTAALTTARSGRCWRSRSRSSPSVRSATRWRRCSARRDRSTDARPPARRARGDARRRRACVHAQPGQAPAGDTCTRRWRRQAPRAAASCRTAA